MNMSLTKNKLKELRTEYSYQNVLKISLNSEEYKSLKFLFNFQGNDKHYLYFYDSSNDNTELYRFLGRELVEILLRKDNCWILFQNTNIN